MKFKYCISLLLLVMSPYIHGGLMAQQEAYKVLYLLPFHVENADEIEVDRIKDMDDLYAVKSFDLFGFWEGAKMALQQFDKDGVALEIYVRDVCQDETKLETVLHEFEDKPLNLIIGPLYGKPFARAAMFAKERKISLVNPFSNRNDFLENNPYVFKAVPAVSACPQLLNKLVLQKLENYNLIFWTDPKNRHKMLPHFEMYCAEKEIPYQTVALSDGSGALTKKLVDGKVNVVIAFYENNDVKVIQNIQELALKDQKVLLVAPESWLSIHNIDMKALNQLHFHYFSNYFVDEAEPAVELFETEYVAAFNSHPSLSRYSYQGYDITRYFVELLRNQYNFYKVEIQPLSFGFDFQKILDGGYENQKQHLLRIENLRLEEVTPETTYTY